VQDHHIGGDPTEEADQVREVGGRPRRLDAGLAREQGPERFPDPFLARGDEDRDRRINRNGLRGHGNSIVGNASHLIRAGPEPAPVGATEPAQRHDAHGCHGTEPWNGTACRVRGQDELEQRDRIPGALLQWSERAVAAVGGDASLLGHERGDGDVERRIAAAGQGAPPHHGSPAVSGHPDAAASVVSTRASP
jgi:hypothetical protein